MSCGRAEILCFRCTYTSAEGIRLFFSRVSSGVVRGRRGFMLARRDKETWGHTIGSPSPRRVGRVPGATNYVIRCARGGVLSHRSLQP
jgi:hypothetical protein